MFIINLLYLTLLIKVSNLTKNMIQQKLVPIMQTNLLPIKILNEYFDHDFYIHMDNNTISSLNSEVLFNIKKVTTVIYNYNTSHKTVPKRLQSDIKVLNVIYLSAPHNFEKYSSVDYIFFKQDAVIFLIENFDKINNNYKTDKRKFWQVNGLDKCSNIFVFDLSKSKLYHCCYYCGENNGKLKEIRYGNLSSHMNLYKNFHGHNFKIGFAYFPPFIACENMGLTKCEPIYAEGKLLLTLSTYLNFKFDLTEFNGGYTGQWERMVRAVHLKQYHWTIGGISISLERMLLTDFSRFITIQGFSVAYSIYDDPLEAIKSTLLPFDYFVWICIIGSIAVICLIAYVANKLLKSPTTTSNFIYLKFAIASIIDQSLPRRKYFSPISLRLIFGLWWFISVALTSVYRSKLTSFLIAYDSYQPETTSELLQSGYRFQVNKQDWTILKENLKLSSDGDNKLVFERASNDLYFCDSIKNTIGHKVAVIEEETPLQVDVYNECLKKNIITTKELSQLRLIENYMFGGGLHAWSFQKSTPYIYRFSEVISRLYDSGILLFWYEDAFTYKIPKCNQEDTQRLEISSLSLKTFIAPIFVLISGLLTATVSFIVEIIHYQRKQNIVKYKNKMVK